jgi:hypothetical protein
MLIKRTARCEYDWRIPFHFFSKSLVFEKMSTLIDQTYYEKMSTLIDQTYYWQGHGNGVGLWQSKCRLRIFQPHPESTIVLVSDLGADCGTSITDCADHLASLIVTEFRLDPEALTWIEHLPDSESEFSLVEFDWLGTIAISPRWSYLTPERVEALIGQSLREANR